MILYTGTMKTTIRLAVLDDIPALQALDDYPKDAIWQQKISQQEVIVLSIDDAVVGLARYGVLWTTVPFLGLIYIAEAYRGKGYSRQMLEFLQQHLQAQGYVALLSSSQTDEAAPQAWHAHMGFHTNGIIENIADDNIGEVVYRLLF